MDGLSLAFSQKRKKRRAPDKPHRIMSVANTKSSGLSFFNSWKQTNCKRNNFRHLLVAMVVDQHEQYFYFVSQRL